MKAEVLGDFSIYRDEVPIPLPASRKTRALMAILVVSQSAQRRDRLTEVFWDVPDDPKGALRWSLTKMRQVFNDSETERLKADRERVFLDHSNLQTDLGILMGVVLDPEATGEALKHALELLSSQRLLDGLELPENPTYMSWLRSQREKIEKFIDSHAMRVVDHPEISPDAALGFARTWFEKMPYSVNAANAILSSLSRSQKERELESERQRLVDHFGAADMEFVPRTDLFSPRVGTEQIEKKPVVLKADPERQQNVRFCRTSDNISIAYASVGNGPPLVKAANWLTHLELDWDAPIWSPLFRSLALDNTFIRYDERGNGLSDWEVPEISQDAFVADLKAVVDAMGLEKFPLLGISQGAAVSIEYACRHPERVSKLILFGGYPTGWRVNATPDVIAEREAIMTLVKTGWGSVNPAYRRIFSTTFMPDANAHQLDWFDEFQRLTTSSKNAARFLSAFGDIDVDALLPEVKVPTLIIHSRHDQRIPWSTARYLASMIPDARLVTLESRNHLLLENEPASDAFLTAIRNFLAE